MNSWNELKLISFDARKNERIMNAMNKMSDRSSQEERLPNGMRRERLTKTKIKRSLLPVVSFLD